MISNFIINLVKGSLRDFCDRRTFLAVFLATLCSFCIAVWSKCISCVSCGYLMQVWRIIPVLFSFTGIVVALAFLVKNRCCKKEGVNCKFGNWIAEAIKGPCYLIGGLMGLTIVVQAFVYLFLIIKCLGFVGVLLSIILSPFLACIIIFWKVFLFIAFFMALFMFPEWVLLDKSSYKLMLQKMVLDWHTYVVVALVAIIPIYCMRAIVLDSLMYCCNIIGKTGVSGFKMTLLSPSFAVFMTPVIIFCMNIVTDLFYANAMLQKIEYDL